MLIGDVKARLVEGGRFDKSMRNYDFEMAVGLLVFGTPLVKPFTDFGWITCVDAVIG
jgi:hypothetical protein